MLVESRPNTNALFITLKGGKGIRYFVYQYTTDSKMGEEGWININSNVRKCTIENLVKGQEYIVRLQCFGSHGQTYCSDPIARLVQ